MNKMKTTCACNPTLMHYCAAQQTEPTLSGIRTALMEYADYLKDGKDAEQTAAFYIGLALLQLRNQ